MKKRQAQIRDEARFLGWTQHEREAHLRKLDKQINRQAQIRAALARVILAESINQRRSSK